MIVALSLGVLAHGETYAGDRTDLVILLDLSQSVAVKGHDSKAEFEKNVQRVSSTVAALPAGSKVSVIGITNDSRSGGTVRLSAGTILSSLERICGRYPKKRWNM